MVYDVSSFCRLLWNKNLDFAQSPDGKTLAINLTEVHVKLALVSCCYLHIQIYLIFNCYTYIYIPAHPLICIHLLINFIKSSRVEATL